MAPANCGPAYGHTLDWGLDVRSAGRVAGVPGKGGCLADPGGAAVGWRQLPYQCARRRAPRHPDGKPARHSLLDRRLGTGERVVLMVSPGVNERPRRLRWVAVAQALLWCAIGLGAFLLLAESVQNSAEFERLRPWILLVDLCGVIVLSV